MQLGDQSLGLLCQKILVKNQYSQLDLSKNLFTDQGLQILAHAVAKTKSLTHISLSNNQLTQDGLCKFFKALEGHQYITSLELQNKDCYTNKIKVGGKGAESLEAVLDHPLCLIANLEITDGCLTPNGHLSIARGIT